MRLDDIASMASFRNRQRWLLSSVCLVVVLWYGRPAEGRLIEYWGWSRLVESSDLVVIAEAVASTDTKDRLMDQGKVSEIGVNTELKVLAVLKGDFREEQFIVFHYRFADVNEQPMNGPQLVYFDSRKPEHAKKIQYLICLRRTDQLIFVPTSGQLDPIYSVRQLDKPTIPEQKAEVPK
jgi:hypothetical protein